MLNYIDSVDVNGENSKMKIIIAPDSFKGALSSPLVCEALKKGWLERRPQDEVLLFPLADGGEGTCEALVRSGQGVFFDCAAHDPLMRAVTCRCGITGKGNTGVMELAAASGIELLSRAELAPLKTTTFGSGEVMKYLLDRGCRHFLLGIGGSATVDGGAGMLQALGAVFYDERGERLPDGIGGGDLKRIARVDWSGLDERIFASRIDVACDVTNPLLGPQGAAVVFGPQKGASPEDVERLEENLEHWAELCGGDCRLPGSGAAGGVGFMLRTVLKGELSSGAELVIKCSGLDDALENASLLITGEGCSDDQTLCGKLPAVAAAHGAQRGVPAVLCSGALKGDCSALEKVFSGVFSISPGAVTLDEAIAATALNLRLTGANLAALATVYQK